MSHSHHHGDCSNWGDLESKIGKTWKDFIPITGAVNYVHRALSALHDERAESHEHSSSRSRYFEAVVIAHTIYAGIGIVSTAILIPYILNR